MKIAIIGGGISGLTAAWLLRRRHDITLYEEAGRLGGHTATVKCSVDGMLHSVDTGFIVFNDRTYPAFNRLIDRLGVGWRNTKMDFSVSCRHGNPGPGRTGLGQDVDFEYAGANLNRLFADRRNLANPAFLGMLADILRFGRRARRDFEAKAIAPDMALEEYLWRGGYGGAFLSKYILPMASAIWSAPVSRVGEFNALFFVRFFLNHGLLSVWGRPRWRTVLGGSSSYIAPLVRSFRNRIRLSTPVRAIIREPRRVLVQTEKDSERYEHVILACHSDQALGMLADASREEREVLRAIPYRDNRVVLHTDPRLLPLRKRAWSSWNYLLDGTENLQPVLTYNMNRLQGIVSTRPICVTMNGCRHIDDGRVLGRYTYAHPQFGPGSVAAQERLGEINGSRNTWFCGAWCGNGFHEDGVVSAAKVSQALGGEAL